MKKSVKKSKKPLKKKSSRYIKSLPVKLQKIVDEDTQRYINVLGMNHYKRKILYMKHDIDPADDGVSNGGVAATCTVDLRYLTATIKIYPYLINAWQKKNVSDEELHEILAHEISHMATNHLYRVGMATFRDEGEMRDAWEALTTVVGRLVHEVDKRRRGFKKTNEK